MTRTRKADVESAVAAAVRLASLVSSEAALDVVAYLVNRDFGMASASDFVSAGLSREDADLIGTELGSLQTAELRLMFTIALDALATQETAPTVELCWTGPRSGVALRSTGPAIEQMIHAAERRIVIAEFDVTEAAEPILRMIEERARAGVEVFLLVDRADEKPALMEWARHCPGVEVWSRKSSPADPLAKFHVKSILVDEKVGMFGSANLTLHGLRGNIEMGILMRDSRIVGRAEEALLDFRREMTRLIPAP